MIIVDDLVQTGGTLIECAKVGGQLGKNTCTVEPRLLDTPPLWTPQHYGHFSQVPFSFQ